MPELALYVSQCITLMFAMHVDAIMLCSRLVCKMNKNLGFFSKSTWESQGIFFEEVRMNPDLLRLSVNY